MKRRVFCLLLATACALGTASIGTASARADDEINIAGGIAFSWAPLYIADQQGFFAKHGLEATVLPFPSGRASQEAVVGGAVAWGTVAETPVVFASINKLPVRVIATMSVYEIFDIVATNDIQKIEDLKGKRVGFAQGTNSQVYLSRILKKAGLATDDITAISLSPPDMVTSLVNGQLDAFIWAEPHLSQAVALGNGQFHTLRTPGVYTQYSGIVALQSTIEDNPEVLVKSLCAMNDAANYMKANKEASIAYVAERIKMDREIVAKEWERTPFEIKLDKATLVQEMAEEAKWAIDSGLAAAGTEAPDYNDIVVTTIFDQAQACMGN